VTAHEGQKKKEKDEKRKKRNRRISNLRTDFRECSIGKTLTSASLCSSLKMILVLVLICDSRQFVFCPSLRENRALQVKDRLIDFHSKA
jgi:hypothetical protein